LGLLHPLRPELAKTLAQSAPITLSSASTTFAATDSLVTRQWLKELPISAQEVILVWDEATALALPWDMFCNYWDDFCYPSSDDVDIFTQNGNVFLRWHHSEVFEYAPLTV